MHLRKTSVAQLLKRNRIRRINAETVLRALREPAINVADGVAEAATIHIGSLITRLRVVGRELHEVCALSKIASNTGARLPGDELMTCKTSAVAVCCFNASRVSVKSRAFSIAITACAAKFCNSTICLSANGRTSSAVTGASSAPDRVTVASGASCRKPPARMQRFSASA